MRPPLASRLQPPMCLVAAVSLQLSIACFMEGYDKRGDRTGNQPTVSWASVADPGSITYIFTTIGTARQTFRNLIANGNNVAHVGGFNVNVSSRTNCSQCQAINCSGTAGVGFNLPGAGMPCKSCKSTNCVTGFANGYVDSCWATSGTTGFSGTASGFNCLATLNTNGFVSSNAIVLLDRCTADSNTTAGFSVAGQADLFSCLSSNQSGGGGIGFSIGSILSTLQNCASYNNTTEVSGNFLLQTGNDPQRLRSRAASPTSRPVPTFARTQQPARARCFEMPVSACLGRPTTLISGQYSIAIRRAQPESS